MNKKRVCILCFSKIAWDSRVLREIEFAAAHYQVDVIGYGDWTGRPGVRFFPLYKTPRTRGYMLRYLAALLAGRLNPAAYERFFWGKGEYGMAREIIRREKYDLIHANDWDALPVAVSAASQTGSKVLFDAHEYTVEQEADRRYWKQTVAPFRDHFLRNYQECVTRRITVSDGVQQLYAKNYGWEMDLVLNAPYYSAFPFRPVDPDRIHIVHHGGSLPSRYIEDYIDLAAALDKRFHLHFILMPTNPGYDRQLRERARQIAPDRVTFHDPVPPAQILGEVAQYDIGVPLMRVRQLSYYYSLPNKFFDYVMAGLAVAVAPLPSMQRIVEQAGNGIIAPDQSWQSMAATLNHLDLERINQYKQRSLELAKQINASSEGQKLLSIYGEMLA